MSGRTVKILMLLAVLASAGCGTSRRAVKTQTRSVREQTTGVRIRTAAETSAQTAAATELRQDEEVVTEVVEFDTTLPADPATGTPPVRRKITRTRRAAAEARQSAASESRTVEVEAADSVAGERSAAATATEERSRRGMHAGQYLLCAVGLLALLGAGAWLRRRR